MIPFWPLLLARLTSRTTNCLRSPLRLARRSCSDIRTWPEASLARFQAGRVYRRLGILPAGYCVDRCRNMVGPDTRSKKRQRSRVERFLLRSASTWRLTSISESFDGIAREAFARMGEGMSLKRSSITPTPISLSIWRLIDSSLLGMYG